MNAPVISWRRMPLDAAARAHALALLSEPELARLEVTAPARRDAFLAGRLLLRLLIADLTDTEPQSVALDAACPDCGVEHGKPAVRGSGWQVSLSHSATAVVAAAAFDTPVGVDVESVDTDDEVLAAVEVVAGEASVTRWTRVEAILKADGRGLRVDPSQVRIDGGIGWVADADRRYRLTEVELAPDLRVSVAVGLSAGPD